MSVTFWAIDPNCNEIVPEGWMPEYEEDEYYGKIQTNSNPLSLNVANGNYVRLMEMVGVLQEDTNGSFCGQMGDGSLQELRDRVKIVLDGIKAMPDTDAGTEDTVFRAEGGATIIQCGLREGYFQDRLEVLLSIVGVAIEKGGMMVWG